MSEVQGEGLRETYGRMPFTERETLMAYLLRHPGLFAEARQVLVPEHFTEAYELIWAVCWRSMVDLHEQVGGMPPKEMLLTDALGRLSDHPAFMPPSAPAELQNFLEYIFDFDGTLMFAPDCQQYGFNLLSKFLRERHWADPMRRLFNEIGDAVPSDVRGLIGEMDRRFTQVSGANQSPISDLEVVHPDEAVTDRKTTGFRFLDVPMGGGTGPGEVYGLLGTFGSGKTMMSCGIGARFCQRELNDALDTGGEPRHLFHFVYETPPKDIRHRVWAHLATIPIDHLARPGYETQLSVAGRRHEYEELMFPTDPRGEAERLGSIRPYLRLYHVGNMRGQKENPKAGTGGVDEIAAELEKYRQRYGWLPGCVIIDYALLCVKRQINANGWDLDKKLRHMVNGFPEECRRLIADRFNCHVWVLQQLSGQANKRAAGQKMSHADSAEAGSFGENLWYAFCLGNKTSDSMVRLDVSKTRNSEDNAGPFILKLDGRFARFVEADEGHMIDPQSNRIVRRSIGEMIAPTTSTARRAAGLRNVIDGAID